VKREAKVGAWGTGIFENDTACDFAENVAKSKDLKALEQALDRVLASEGDYLEAPDAEEGLAAADVVARLMGRSRTRTPYTAPIDAWVERMESAPSEELVEKARRSIARILAEPSEILELWQESEDFALWKRAVEEIAEHL
jgi:hypothetical protein